MATEDPTVPNIAPASTTEAEAVAAALAAAPPSSEFVKADGHPVPMTGLLGLKPVFERRIGEPGYAGVLAARLRAAGYEAEAIPNEKPIGDALKYTAPIAAFREINEKLAKDWDAGMRR